MICGDCLALTMMVDNLRSRFCPFILIRVLMVGVLSNITIIRCELEAIYQQFIFLITASAISKSNCVSISIEEYLSIIYA